MSKITKDTEFNRPCPECGDILYYSCKRYVNRAENNKSVCRSCRKMPESMKKKLSEYWTGRKNPNYPSTKKGITEHSEWRYDCPDCGKVRYYARKDNMVRAKQKVAICNRCSAYKYKKTWNDVIEKGIVNCPNIPDLSEYSLGDPNATTVFSGSINNEV